MFRSLVHLCLGLLLQIAAVDASAQQKSPKGEIIVQGERLDDGGQKSSDTRKIWLVSATDPNKRELLFTHYRGADVVFSSDENWLAINDHLASNQSALLLYKRTAGLHYESVADLTNAAWSFVWQQNGGETQFGLAQEAANQNAANPARPHGQPKSRLRLALSL